MGIAVPELKGGELNRRLPTTVAAAGRSPNNVLGQFSMRIEVKVVELQIVDLGAETPECVFSEEDPMKLLQEGLVREYEDAFSGMCFPKISVKRLSPLSELQKSLSIGGGDRMREIADTHIFKSWELTSDLFGLQPLQLSVVALGTIVADDDRVLGQRCAETRALERAQ
jgi:hypothetical protein